MNHLPHLIIIIIHFLAPKRASPLSNFQIIYATKRKINKSINKKIKKNKKKERKWDGPFFQVRKLDIYYLPEIPSGAPKNLRICPLPWPRWAFW
jgi:hypothetical protein